MRISSEVKVERQCESPEVYSQVLRPELQQVKPELQQIQCETGAVIDLTGIMQADPRDVKVKIEVNLTGATQHYLQKVKVETTVDLTGGDAACRKRIKLEEGNGVPARQIDGSEKHNKRKHGHHKHVSSSCCQSAAPCACGAQVTICSAAGCCKSMQQGAGGLHHFSQMQLVLLSWVWNILL